MVHVVIGFAGYVVAHRPVTCHAHSSRTAQGIKTGARGVTSLNVSGEQFTIGIYDDAVFAFFHAYTMRMFPFALLQRCGDGFTGS
jgi:hypothetical protein